MRLFGMAHISGKQERRLRKSQRKREFVAACLARDNHSEPLNCLIRDISEDGAQIRLNADQPVPAQVYMINLKTGSAHEAQVVWRRESLTGLSLGKKYAINALLPAHLEFLQSLFIEAKMRQVDQLIWGGLGTAAALRKCGIAEELYRRGRGISLQ